MRKYLYIGTSFVTFKFDELSFLACKYYLTKFHFIKRIYLKRINTICYKKKKYNPIVSYEKFFIKHTIDALENSSILISSNKKEIKLYSQIKNKDIHVEEKFDISCLNDQILNQETCLIVYSKKDLKKLDYLTTFLDKFKIICLDELIDDEFNQEFIFDRLKVRLLQGEHEIYFIHCEGYDNYIANFFFELNKIAIHV